MNKKKEATDNVVMVPEHVTYAADMLLARTTAQGMAFAAVVASLVHYIDDGETIDTVGSVFTAAFEADMWERLSKEWPNVPDGFTFGMGKGQGAKEAARAHSFDAFEIVRTVLNARTTVSEAKAAIKLHGLSKAGNITAAGRSALSDIIEGITPKAVAIGKKSAAKKGGASKGGAKAAGKLTAAKAKAEISALAAQYAADTADIIARVPKAQRAALKLLVSGALNDALATAKAEKLAKASK